MLRQFMGMQLAHSLLLISSPAKLPNPWGGWLIGALWQQKRRGANAKIGRGDPSLLRFFMNHPFLMTQWVSWVSSSRLSTCKRTEPDDRCLAEMAPVKLLVFREDLPAEKIHSEPKLQMLVTVGVSLLSCSKFEACDHVIGFWVRRNIQTNCYSTISPTGGVLEIKWLYIHPPINNQTITTITRL
jgi:hypothetical protein